MLKSPIPAAGGAMPATVALLRPMGAPHGVSAQEWRAAAEARVNALLEAATALIEALDTMEADPDLEETGDDEPSLGWPLRGPSAYGATEGDDRELDETDDEDGGDNEPTLGAPERGGWYVSQEHWADGAKGDHEREDVSEDEGAACEDEGSADRCEW